MLSVAELGRCGLSRDAITVRVRHGWLHRRHQGVYAVGHANLTLQGEFLAAVKACGSVAGLSHYAAASHWGWVEWDGRYPEVTVPEGRSRRHPGIRIHYSHYVDPIDFRHRDGIRVTAPARTLVDLASLLPYAALRVGGREGTVAAARLGRESR